MNDTEQEFIKATGRWYEFVGRDHHKDRDCHWYVTKDEVYSYGEPSKQSGYSVRHRGYIADDQEFWGETKELAMKEATDFMYDFMAERDPTQ
jgi:hypothetical protein